MLGEQLPRAAIATAGCVTGGDPEKIQRLPNLEGLKDQVIMPRQSRNEYDHAIRSVGVNVVNVDSKEELLAALGLRTAMVAVLGERPGRIPLEEISAMGRKAGVPVLVDAAAEVPSLPNKYLQQGADMVARKRSPSVIRWSRSRNRYVRKRRGRPARQGGTQSAVHRFGDARCVSSNETGRPGGSVSPLARLSFDTHVYAVGSGNDIGRASLRGLAAAARFSRKASLEQWGIFAPACCFGEA